jgi:hypothetical protein
VGGHVSGPQTTEESDAYLGAPRGAEFDADGKRIVYLRGGAQPALIVRELSSGDEQVLDPGPGLVLRARFAAERPWLVAEIAASGKLPDILTTLAPRRCRGSAVSYSVFGGADSAAPIVRLLPLGGGQSIDVGTALDVDPDALVRPRALRAHRVHTVDQDPSIPPGAYARRSDGAVLAPDAPRSQSARARQRLFELPVGPLRWQVPAARSRR